MYIAIVGNLSQGYRFFGPYCSFDDAAEAFPGSDTWIVTLEEINQANGILCETK